MIHKKDMDDISNQRELRVFCQNLIKVNDILTIVI